MSRRKLTITASALVVTLAAALTINRIMNGPANGTITTVIGFTSETAPAVTSVSASTPYATFSYPSSFTAQTVDAPKEPVLVNLRYIKPDVTHWQLGVTLVRVAESSLTADSSYALRASQPSNFQPSSVTIAASGQTFSLMRYLPSGAYAVVAYSLHGTTVAEISIKGTDTRGNASVAATLHDVLASWRWR